MKSIFSIRSTPFPLGAEAGDARRQRVREKFHAGENRKLIAMVMAEFDRRPRAAARVWRRLFGRELPPLRHAG
jgi:hypothetical protein